MPLVILLLVSGLQAKAQVVLEPAAQTPLQPNLT